MTTNSSRLCGNLSSSDKDVFSYRLYDAVARTWNDINSPFGVLKGDIALDQVQLPPCHLPASVTGRSVVRQLQGRHNTFRSAEETTYIAVSATIVVNITLSMPPSVNAELLADALSLAYASAAARGILSSGFGVMYGILSVNSVSVSTSQGIIDLPLSQGPPQSTSHDDLKGDKVNRMSLVLVLVLTIGSLACIAVVLLVKGCITTRGRPSVGGRQSIQGGGSVLSQNSVFVSGDVPAGEQEEDIQQPLKCQHRFEMTPLIGGDDRSKGFKNEDG